MACRYGLLAALLFAIAGCAASARTSQPNSRDGPATSMGRAPLAPTQKMAPTQKAADDFNRAQARGQVWTELGHTPLDKGLLNGLLGHEGVPYRLDRERRTLARLDPATLAPTWTLDLSSAIQSGRGISVRSLETLLLVMSERAPRIDIAVVDPRAVRVTEARTFEHGGAPGATLRGVSLAPQRVYFFLDREFVRSARTTVASAFSAVPAQIVALDRSTGALVSRMPLATNHIHDAQVVGDMAYVVGDRDVVGVDLVHSKVRWRHQKRDWPRVLATAELVYLSDGGELLELEPESGRARARTTMASDPRPRNLTGKLEVDAWLLGKQAHGPYWISSWHDRLALLRRDSLEPEHTFELEQDWSYLGQPFSVGDELWATRILRHDPKPAEVELVRYGQTPAEALDTSALPQGTELYASGRRLDADAVWLPLGPQRVELFRDGFAPNRAERVLRGGEATKLAPLAPWQAEVAAVREVERQLPVGTEILDLLGRSSLRRDVKKGRFGRSAQAGYWLTLDPKVGFFAEDVMSGRRRFKVEMGALRDALPKDAKVTEATLAALEIRSVLPHSKLVILGTEGQERNVLLALDLETGARRWSSRVGSFDAGARFLGESASIAEYLGLLWYGDGTVLYARDLEQGRLVYRLQAGDRDDSLGTPVFARGRVFFTYDGQLRAFRIADQKALWQVPVADKTRVLADAATDDIWLIDSGQVRRVSFDGKVLARSRAALQGVVNMPPLVAADAVYLCGHDSDVYALDKRSLSLTWSFRDQSQRSPCPSVVSEGQLLVVGDSHGWIFERRSGKLVKEMDLPDLGQVTHVLQVDGTLCLIDSDETCYRR